MLRFIATIIVCLVWIGGYRFANGQELVPEHIRTILSKNCTECHGGDFANPAAAKELPDIFDLKYLIDKQKIVPGDPDASKLWRMVESDRMPDGIQKDDTGKVLFTSKRKPLSDEEKGQLKKWIVEMAGSRAVAEIVRPFVSQRDVLASILADVDLTERGSVKGYRYVSFDVLYNNPEVTDSALDQYRQAFVKLVNSVTYSKHLFSPRPIDKNNLVYRLDLNELKWPAENWDALVATNPYKQFEPSVTAEVLKRILGTDQPIVRADWFVKKVSEPPIYFLFVDVPKNSDELEKRLLRGLTANEVVEGVVESSHGEAVRAGMTTSGVSRNNRVVERLETDAGGYWRSFDFKDPDPNDPERARKSIRATPTGPFTVDGFLPDGGEVIFTLPNGLQAYMIYNAKGERLEAAPIEVVRDDRANSPTDKQEVVTGISCMSCHTKGMKVAVDDLADPVSKGSFSVETRNFVERLHDEKKFRARLDEDELRFRASLKLLGVSEDDNAEPITALVRFYKNERIKVPEAAAELNIPRDELLAKLGTIDPGDQVSLKTGGFTRKEFEQAFSRIASKLGIFTELEELKKSRPIDLPDPSAVDISQRLKEENARLSLQLAEAEKSGGENAVVKLELGSLKREVDRLQASEQEQKRGIAELEATREELNRHIESLERDATANKTKIDELESDRNDLDRQLEMKSAQVLSKDAELEAAKARVATAEGTLLDVNRQLSEARQYDECHYATSMSPQVFGWAFYGSGFESKSKWENRAFDIADTAEVRREPRPGDIIEATTNVVIRKCFPDISAEGTQLDLASKLDNEVPINVAMGDRYLVRYVTRLPGKKGERFWVALQTPDTPYDWIVMRGPYAKRDEAEKQQIVMKEAGIVSDVLESGRLARMKAGSYVVVLGAFSSREGATKAYLDAKAAAPDCFASHTCAYEAFVRFGH